jgi:hypothetical protein
MPANRKFAAPGDGLSIRDPLTNERKKGNIMNPRRYMDFGGLTGANVRGLTAAMPEQNVKPPSATQRGYPVK